MKLLAFDVETSGTDKAFALQPFRAKTGDAWLTSYAVAHRPRNEINTAGTLFPATDQLRRLLVRCAEKGVRIVCWNAPFDVAWLIALGLEAEVMACKWLDAMLLYRHLSMEPTFVPDHEVKSYGLKPAVERFYPDEAGYEEGVDFHATDEPNLDKLLHYNKLDCTFTLRLAEDFLAKMTPRMLRNALIEADSIPLVALSMVNGIEADGPAAEALSERLLGDSNLAFVKLKFEDAEAITPEVLASPKQLGELLFDKWRLPAYRLSDAGNRSTDKETLMWLAHHDPRAQLVRDYREAKNGRTKYAEATVNSLAYNGDGRVRPGPRLYGTYTGRLTYASKQGGYRGEPEVQTGIALHQWKRDKGYRNLLVAPDGYDLLEHDFAGQEFKWMAVAADDYTMLKLCQPGEDAHSFMGGRVQGVPYRELMARVAAGDPLAKPIRQLGKVANLSLQYRTSWMTLVKVALKDYGVVLTDAEARSIHATYLTTYLQVPEYWRRQIYRARRDGYVETFAGRRVQLGTGEKWTKETKWARESTALNFPIQGVGADQKYLALKVLRDYLPRVNGVFYWELHDGIFTLAPSAKAEKAAVEIRHLLSNLPYKEAWGKSFPIQFPVDAKMGKSWGTLKDVA